MDADGQTTRKQYTPSPLPPPGYNNTNQALILLHSSGPFPSRSQDFGRISRHFYWQNHQETHLQPGRYSCLLQRESGLIIMDGNQRCNVYVLRAGGLQLQNKIFVLYFCIVLLTDRHGKCTLTPKMSLFAVP